MMHTLRAILICLLVLLTALMLWVTPSQATEWEYKDVRIDPQLYDGKLLSKSYEDTTGTKYEIEITLNEGPACRIWITRGMYDEVYDDYWDLEVEKAITGAGNKVVFSFEAPDNHEYHLYIFNDDPTQEISVDIYFTDNVGFGIGAGAIAALLVIIIIITVVILIVAKKVKGKRDSKKNPPSPPSYGGYPPQHGGYPQQYGGYPPPHQGGYPPQQQGGYPPQQQGEFPPQQLGGPPPQQPGYPPGQQPPGY